MVRLTLVRADRLPECCVLCGTAATSKQTLKFGLKAEQSTLTAVVLPKFLKYLSRVRPSIAWRLPFCDTHGRQASICRRLQLPLFLLGLILIPVGFVLLTALSPIWPFCVTWFVSVLLLFFSHPHFISTHQVTPNLIELEVDEKFAAGLKEANRIEVPDAEFYTARPPEEDELTSFFGIQETERNDDFRNPTDDGMTASK